MKKFFIIISIVIVLFIGCIATIFLLLPEKNMFLKLNENIGVWWWDKDSEHVDEYLAYAKETGVDEIYYCDYSMNEETYQFVKKAKEKNIKIYALWGECYWINDKTGFDELIERYKEYNSLYADAPFDGVHLDIEPHQLDEFHSSRNELMKRYVEFVINVVKENPNIAFDFDVPAWAHDSVEINRSKKPVYAHVMDNANRVFIMSYRDSAEAILELAKDELAYAKANNKTMAVCVEMESKEGEHVSFQQESKKILYDELKKLESLIDQEYMISIHNMKTWYDLKDE